MSGSIELEKGGQNVMGSLRQQTRLQHTNNTMPELKAKNFIGERDIPDYIWFGFCKKLIKAKGLPQKPRK